MKEQFDITLWNRWLYSWLVVPLLLAALAVVAAIWSSLLHQLGGKWGFVSLGLLLCLGCLYGLDRLTRRPARVLVTAECLQLQYTGRGTSFEVAWADVASYKDAALNGGRELQLRLHFGRKKALAVSATQGNLLEYFRLVQAVEQATAAYNDLHGTAIVKRSNFFEKIVFKISLAVSTVLLIMLVIRSCGS